MRNNCDNMFCLFKNENKISQKLSHETRNNSSVVVVVRVRLTS